MDPSKKSRIPTRVCINPEKCRYGEKENFTKQKRKVEQVKPSKSHTATTTASQIKNGNLDIPIPRQRILSDTALLPPTKKVKIAANTATTTASQIKNRNFDIPIPRHRILSDTALLPPRKKIKITVTRPKLDTVTRPPLGDLDRNTANKNVEVSDAKVKEHVRIIKTVRFKDVDTAAIHIHKEVEEIVESKTVANTEHGYTTNTYRSKSTLLTNYKILQPTTAENLQILTLPSAKPTTTKQSSKAKTPELHTAVAVDKKDAVRKRLTFISKDDPYLDEMYVNPSQHFISFKQPEQNYERSMHHTHQNDGGYISPIKSNPYATKSTLIFQGIPEEVRRPAKKMTLIHKMHPESRQGNSTAYCLDIYSTEYLNDIVHCQLKDDWKYVLKNDFLKINNPRTVQMRAAVVNWLIQAQDYLNLSQTVLFTTVRLFDRALENISIPCNMCQLVGLVIMWIINKFEDCVNPLTASNLSALCNGAYLNRDILKMEKKLLKFFNYDLKIPDVTLYVEFYLKKLNIESDVLLYCAFYILECYMLNVKFSTVSPSVQAAAAIRLALSILFPLSQTWQQLKGTVGYYTEKDLDHVMQEMAKQLQIIQDPAYENRQPYHKYAAINKAQVSFVLLRKLVAT